MSSDEIEFEDVEDALRRADELAELTGREKKDVIADLLDDGVLNKSAGEDAEEKKDFLDKAQEQAEKLKTLLTTLIPIFALLMGIGAEGLGVLDLTDWGSESIWDGDNENNSVGCDPMWGYDEYGYLDDNNLEVRYTFQDYNNCGIEHFGGHFIITLFESGDETEQVFIHNIDFIDYISIEHTFMDLEGGDYHYRVEFHVVECEDGSCEHGDEYYLPTSNDYYIETVESCDAYFINEQAYILEDDVEKDAVRISADVALVEGARNCDGEQFEITWQLYEDNEVKYEHTTWEDGVVTDPDGADYTFHTWNDVNVGTYTPKVILNLNGEDVDDKWIAHTISIEEQTIQGCTDSEATNYNDAATDDDGSCEYPEPEVCEINLYSIMLGTNSTHATVVYDLDCGYQENELEGYNVSVQFLVFEVGSENNTSSQPIVWDTTLSYVQGWEYDNNSLTLTNFTSNNTTHYDFYWYATWADSNEDMKFIERKWLNRELNA